MKMGKRKYFSAGECVPGGFGGSPRHTSSAFTVIPKKGGTEPPDNLAAYSLIRLAGCPNDGDHREDNENLYGAHLVTTLVKRLIRGTFQGRFEPKYLQNYLDEFIFRFNRRKSKSIGKKFMRIVQQAVNSSKITCKQILWDMDPISEYYALSFVENRKNNLGRYGHWAALLLRKTVGKRLHLKTGHLIVRCSYDLPMFVIEKIMADTFLPEMLLTNTTYAR
jgi:hypothetical protein